MSPQTGKTLGRFHHRVARLLEKIKPKRDSTGMWIYSLLDADIKAVGLEGVQTYVLRR